MLVKSQKSTDRIPSHSNDLFFCRWKTTYAKTKTLSKNNHSAQEQTAIQKIIKSITEKNHNAKPQSTTQCSSNVSSSRGIIPKAASYLTSPVLKQKPRCASQILLNQSQSPQKRIHSSKIHSPTKTFYSINKERKVDAFIFLSVLGQGKFGKVFLSQHKASKQFFAIKTIQKKQMKENDLGHQLKREINIQKELRHKNILKLFDYFEDERYYYLQMEHAKEGSLFQYIIKQPNRYVVEKEAAPLIKQVVQAVQFMHSKDVIHRDLKPENILLCEKNQIKVSDFGWSIKMDRKERDTLCGTLEYLSPEMLNRQGYDFSIDIWAIGVLIFEVCTGRPPFSNPAQGDISDLVYPEHLSDNVKDLISHLLVSRKARKSLDWILRHRWLNV